MILVRWNAIEAACLGSSCVDVRLHLAWLGCLPVHPAAVLQEKTSQARDESKVSPLVNSSSHVRCQEKGVHVMTSLQTRPAFPCRKLALVQQRGSRKNNRERREKENVGANFRHSLLPIMPSWTAGDRFLYPLFVLAPYGSRSSLAVSQLARRRERCSPWHCGR